MQTAAELDVLLEHAEKAVAEALDIAADIRRRRNAARLAEANHPWMGRRVIARQRYMGWNRNPRDLIGTVVAYDPAAHGRIRGGPFGRYGRDSVIGAPVVLSDSGKSMWALGNLSGESPFELLDPDTEKRVK